jgi:hypothetical protein
MNSFIILQFKTESLSATILAKISPQISTSLSNSPHAYAAI